MRNFSLKWLIFSFYMVFGYFPLMLTSFIIINAYSRSVESITEERMNSLVLQVSDQTTMFYEELSRDLDLLGQFPSTRFALLNPTPSQNLKDREDDLRLFRKKNVYSSLSLYSREGLLIVRSVAPSYAWDDGPPFEPPLSIAEPFLFHKVRHGEKWFCQIVRPLFLGHNSMGPDGFAVADIDLVKFTAFLSKADVGQGAEKLILDEEEIVLWKQITAPPPKQTALQKTREYSTDVRGLGWRLVVRIPESVLLGDINRLVVKYLFFSGLVALLAAAAAFEFSRRTTNHLQTILQGARAFASGNLEHHIDVQYGLETRALAREFNIMAQKLNERQAELIQANKLASLGLLSSGIAHEIKNPLAGIKTSAQVLQEMLGSTAQDNAESTVSGEDRRQMKELAGGVREEVDRLTKLLNRLLEFARPQPPLKTDCDLVPIVDRSLSLVQSEIRKKNLKIIRDVRPVSANVDPDQILQVMVNLLLNAIRAVKPGSGQIRISITRDHENRPVIVVADNGAGIPAEVIDRIYDPFCSLNKNGIGLGLSVVYSLLLQNNVHIKVGNAKNGGAVFSLTFNVESSNREC
jgi:signal transduction histidine kinase